MRMTAQLSDFLGYFQARHAAGAVPRKPPRSPLDPAFPGGSYCCLDAVLDVAPAQDIWDGHFTLFSLSWLADRVVTRLTAAGRGLRDVRETSATTFAA